MLDAIFMDLFDFGHFLIIIIISSTVYNIDYLSRDNHTIDIIMINHFQTTDDWILCPARSHR